MRTRRAVLCCLLLSSLPLARAESFLDQIEETLSVSAFDTFVRARLGGTIELEGYRVQQPSPGLIFTAGRELFSPRLVLFLDAQVGSRMYAFAQSRWDRGFDPGAGGGQLRLDEYAVRFTAGSGRFHFQVGKFATVVGNWVPRHGSWENPFVTAPLVYENQTAVWDTTAARTSTQLLNWAHIRPTPLATVVLEKPLRSPIIWGPSYTAGAAIGAQFGQFRFAAEVKNGSLSSHPETWDIGSTRWRHPTVSGRIGYRPNQMWNFGFSASSGSYLRPSAATTLLPRRGLAEYREVVVGHDLGFAWRRFQFWSEVYHARFAIPDLGNADTISYYAEAKYKFTPQLFGSVRWNQQFYGTIPDGAGGRTVWGRDIWRVDVAPTYRFTPHTQVKFQYSLQHERQAVRNYAQSLALQFVLRF